MNDQHRNIILITLVCYGPDAWVTLNDLSEALFNAHLPGYPGYPPRDVCDEWAREAAESLRRDGLLEAHPDTCNELRLTRLGSKQAAEALIRTLLMRRG